MQENDDALLMSFVGGFFNTLNFFQTIERLLDGVTEFFQDLAARPDIVRSVAGSAA